METFILLFELHECMIKYIQAKAYKNNYWNMILCFQNEEKKVKENQLWPVVLFSGFYNHLKKPISYAISPKILKPLNTYFSEKRS